MARDSAPAQRRLGFDQPPVVRATGRWPSKRLLRAGWALPQDGVHDLADRRVVDRPAERGASWTVGEVVCLVGSASMSRDRPDRVCCQQASAGRLLLQRLRRHWCADADVHPDLLNRRVAGKVQGSGSRVQGRRGRYFFRV